MKEILDKLNADLAKEVMARENARRTYQGSQKEERIAYHSGRIEYIQELIDTINSKK